MGTVMLQEIIHMAKGDEFIDFYVIQQYLSLSVGMGGGSCV